MGLPPLHERQVVYTGVDGTEWVQVYESETVAGRYTESEMRRGYGIPSAVRGKVDQTKGGFLK